ncbi:hypothetical protein [Fontivita pretiosa]|uniref:hypothetical protein n=1 Tax=Fontivita pretiosa TaxID=2989684 RepID=UPI003D162470
METVSQQQLPSLDPDSLKARFKARREAVNNVYQNWAIRVHRSISWAKWAGQLSDDHPEAQLLFLWIALNSLYSKWNNRDNQPDSDRDSRGEFIRKVCRMDSPLIGAVLRRHKPLLKQLLGEPCLSPAFWRNPSHPDARTLATKDLYHLDRNLKSPDCGRLLFQVLDRIALLRGQIVHGAATGGSQLNRRAVRSSLEMLKALVPILQHIVIEHGCNDDWPELCYPPLP